jgi:hypothetical protein
LPALRNGIFRQGCTIWRNAFSQKAMFENCACLMKRHAYEKTRWLFALAPRLMTSNTIQDLLIIFFNRIRLYVFN